MAKLAKRTLGRTRETGYQVGARKTLPIPAKELWNFLISREGVRLWLGECPEFAMLKGVTYRQPNGTEGEVKLCSKNSHLRITCQPPGWIRPSTIQIRLIPKQDKTQVAFHQEHLPGPRERRDRKVFFTEVLRELERLFKYV